MIEQPEITPELLRKLLRYEADSGKLFWRSRPRDMFTSDREYKRWNGRYAWTEASYKRCQTGYRGMFVFRKSLAAHRVAWAIHHGRLPNGVIDHINGVRDDNRLVNLRDVTRSENCRNAARSSLNTSGAVGVVRHKNQWRAYMNLHLGIFDTFEEAVAARKEAERQLGYHPNHGERAPRAQHGVVWSNEKEGNQ